MAEDEFVAGLALFCLLLHPLQLFFVDPVVEVGQEAIIEIKTEGVEGDKQGLFLSLAVLERERYVFEVLGAVGRVVHEELLELGLKRKLGPPCVPVEVVVANDGVKGIFPSPVS